MTFTSQDITKIIHAFPLENYYCSPEEVLQVESKRAHRDHFNIIHQESGLKADMYFLSNETYQYDAMKRRTREEFSGEHFWIAPPEYVILWKLLFYRERRSQKHITDVQSMLDVSYERINHPLLHEYIERFSLSKEWSLCKGKSTTP